MRNELLSLAKAEADYGVVIDRPERRHRRATARSRAEIRAARGWRERARRCSEKTRCRRHEKQPEAVTSYRVGVDVGGTFTDIVLLGSDGTIHTKKISSSVENYAQAIVEGLTEVFRETGLAGAAIEEIRHGTTVASNAILEHKGARTGLDHDQGLSRRARDPHAAHAAHVRHGLDQARAARRALPAPGGGRARRRRRRVVERALDPSDAERARGRAARGEGRGDRGVPAAFVRQSGARVVDSGRSSSGRRRSLPCSISCEVLPEIKEYERTSTTVVNAYVMPIVATLPASAAQGPGRARACARALLLMQSNGGLTTDAAAAERPMHIIESGPAGGVVGAQALARAKTLAEDHHLRHGRDHREGGDGRGRRGDARPGVLGRRRHHDRLAPADGRGLHAQGAGDRSRRGGRRRRLAGVDRCRAARCRSARKARAPRLVRCATTRAARRRR